MSKLQMGGRPYVVFNANLQEHRKWFSDFQIHRSWSQCPVRFLIDDSIGDLVTMIQRKLIAYYTTVEFGAVTEN
jgi:hypothetical protein